MVLLALPRHEGYTLYAVQQLRAVHPHMGGVAVRQYLAVAYELAVHKAGDYAGMAHVYHDVGGREYHVDHLVAVVQYAAYLQQAPGGNDRVFGGAGYRYGFGAHGQTVSVQSYHAHLAVGKLYEHSTEYGLGIVLCRCEYALAYHVL